MNWLDVNFHEAEKYFGISIFEHQNIVVLVFFPLKEFMFARPHVEEVEPGISSCKDESNNRCCCIYVWEGGICVIVWSEVNEL